MYLGSIFTKDGRDSKYIRHRVAQARKIIGALNGVWWSQDITKNRMFKSVLTYGAETSCLYEDERRRINGTEMDALRRSARISKLDRKTNEYIREQMDAQEIVLDDVTRKKLIWCGHFERMNRTGLAEIMINWEPEGREKRGRPRRTCKDGIYRAMSGRELRVGEWNSRREWSVEGGRCRQTL